MRRKPLALIFVVLVVLVSLLTGCRRSAVPPIDVLVPEEDLNAAMQEALENTQGQPSSDQATEPPPAETPEDGEAPAAPAEAEEAPAVATEPASPSSGETTAPAADATAPVAGQASTHVVQPGETLTRIAQRHNTTVAALTQANNITNPNMLSVGQRLVIPASTGSPGATTPSGSSCATTYTVKQGDNLFRIALRHNYTQAYLARVNGITNPALIRVGQVICIP
jgi:LysM repeat protein